VQGLAPAAWQPPRATARRRRSTDDRGRKEATLHPDEHRALELIAARLRAAEPHLAAMFGIFNRLTAQAGDPPDEDRIRPAGRHRAAGSSPAAPGELGSSLRVMLIPAVLLMTLVVVCTVILSGGGSCAPLDRAAVFAYHTAKVTACEKAQTRKAIATISR
jgi:hypothetical protein